MRFLMVVDVGCWRGFCRCWKLLGAMCCTISVAVQRTGEFSRLNLRLFLMFFL